MSSRIQLRRGAAAAWTAANPVLLVGEPGYETDTGLEKRGDGTTAWASLSYALPNVPLAPERFGAKGDGTTDDTTAIQNAINAASVIGTSMGTRCPLKFTPGKKYVWTSVIPKSYVDIDAQGAVFERLPSYAGTLSLFYVNPGLSVGSAVTEFGIRGARMGGLGGETSFQGFCFMSQSTYLTFADNHIHDLAANPFYLIDCQNIWVERNRLINCTVQNPINFVSGSNGNATPLKHIWCDKNTVTGYGAIGICVVGATNSNRTDPVVDAHITNNTCEAAAGGVWPIAVEQGGTGAAPNVSDIDISGNTCTVVSSGSTTMYGIVLTNDSAPASNDPLCMSDVTVRGNRVTSTGSTNSHGILCLASNAIIEGNTINAANTDIVVQGHGTAVVHHIALGPNAGGRGTGGRVLLFGALWDGLTLTVKGEAPRVGPVTVTVPATAVAVAAVGYDRTFYVTAGATACTMTLQDTRAIVVPATAMGTVIVPAGQTVTPTFANAPTWVVEGD